MTANSMKLVAVAVIGGLMFSPVLLNKLSPQTQSAIMKWTTLLAGGGLGLALVAGGLVWGGRRFNLRQSGERTMGTVVENFESAKTEKVPGKTTSVQLLTYYPVVEFSAAGKTLRFRGSTGSDVPEYKVGASVGLIYSRENPSVAQIANFNQFWLGPLVLVLAGLIPLGFIFGSFVFSGGAGPAPVGFAAAQNIVGQAGQPARLSPFAPGGFAGAEENELLRRDKMARLCFGWVILILGVVLLVSSGVGWVRRARFLDKAIEVRGRIVDYVQTSSRHTDTSGIPGRNGRKVMEVGTRPVIEFMTQDGRAIRFVSSLNTRQDTPAEPPVLYVPADPDHAQQKHFFVQTGWVLVLTALGIALSAMGAALLFRKGV